jgi:hypothetical protein
MRRCKRCCPHVQHVQLLLLAPAPRAAVLRTCSALAGEEGPVRILVKITYRLGIDSGTSKHPCSTSAAAYTCSARAAAASPLVRTCRCPSRRIRAAAQPARALPPLPSHRARRRCVPAPLSHQARPLLPTNCSASSQAPGEPSPHHGVRCATQPRGRDSACKVPLLLRRPPRGRLGKLGPHRQARRWRARRRGCGRRHILRAPQPAAGSRRRRRRGKDAGGGNRGLRARRRHVPVAALRSRPAVLPPLVRRTPRGDAAVARQREREHRRVVPGPRRAEAARGPPAARRRGGGGGGGVVEPRHGRRRRLLRRRDRQPARLLRRTCARRAGQTRARRAGRTR